MTICPYCERNDHHLCYGKHACACLHTAKEQLAASERYHSVLRK
jgi:hypothetical protein